MDSAIEVQVSVTRRLIPTGGERSFADGPSRTAGTTHGRACASFRRRGLRGRAQSTRTAHASQSVRHGRHRDSGLRNPARKRSRVGKGISSRASS